MPCAACIQKIKLEKEITKDIYYIKIKQETAILLAQLEVSLDLL